MDMLVKLYDLPDYIPELTKLKAEGFEIKRAMAPDKSKMLDYVKQNFNEGWVSECDVAFSNKPGSCFIAVKDKTVIGFACYNTTAPDYFGPMGISNDYRGKGLGKVLLLKCLLALKAEGYGYAIIGGVGPVDFYVRAVNATVIENSLPGIYEQRIGY